MRIPQSHIRRYWFGIENEKDIADTVLLMERDRLEQYKAAFDLTLCQFNGVFSGITGIYKGQHLSIIYSIGPAHVADCVSFLAYGFEVKRLIATGSIGGLATEIGDLVVVNACATQDGFSLVNFRDKVQQNKKLGPFVQIDLSPPSIVPQHICDQIKAKFNCDIRYGSIFTVPAICLENTDQLMEIKAIGHIAIDLESGPFLAACRKNDLKGLCLHWVTDLPLERSFYYSYDGDPAVIERDRQKKHRQWLNMPRLILPILLGWMNVNAE